MELLQETLLTRPELQKNAVTVKAPLHKVLAHAVLLQQCLGNLLENALKFVAPGVEPQVVIWTSPVTQGTETLGVEDSRRGFIPAALAYSTPGAPATGLPAAGRRIRIWVQDNGIGIAPEWREKVFGIFERAHQAGDYEGTGIGLAIVARAMQRMNGSCGVDPGETQGSRFWLELPEAP